LFHDFERIEKARRRQDFGADGARGLTRLGLPREGQRDNEARARRLVSRSENRRVRVMRKSHLTASLVVVVIGCTAPGQMGQEVIGQARQLVTNGTYYKLTMPKMVGDTGNCVSIDDASTAQGGEIEEWSCVAGTGAQSYKAIEIKDSTGATCGGWFQLQNTNSGYCVDIAGGSAANGANVHQWTCKAAPSACPTASDSIANQAWKFVSSNGYYKIQTLDNTSYCLTVSPVWSSQDVGAVGAVGSFSRSGNTFSVDGAGADIYGTADEFRYVYHNGAGDVTIAARVTSIENVGSTWSKAGVMMREGVGASARNVAMIASTTTTNKFRFQVRSSTGGSTVGTSSGTACGDGALPVWLRLTRSGNNFTGYCSTDGATWTQVGSTTSISMTQTLQVGLAVTSHVDATLATGVFDHVTSSANGTNVEVSTCGTNLANQTFNTVGTTNNTACTYTNWSSGTQYHAGDIVYYSGSTEHYYQAMLDNAGTNPTSDTASWDPHRCGAGGDPSAGIAGVVSSSQFNTLFPTSGTCGHWDDQGLWKTDWCTTPGISGCHQCRSSFYSYTGLTSTSAAYATFANSSDSTLRKREAAAFLANVSHEADWLHAVREYNTANYCSYCDPNQPFGCPAGTCEYYGRGPIQLSWNFNYKAAGTAIGSDLLNNPDLVATNPDVAMKSGVWYWMTGVGPGGYGNNAHDAILGSNGSGGFGATINHINGSLECNKACGTVGSTQMLIRVDRYKAICDYLGVSYGNHTACGDCCDRSSSYCYQ
jgi:chitinase